MKGNTRKKNRNGQKNHNGMLCRLLPSQNRGRSCSARRNVRRSSSSARRISGKTASNWTRSTTKSSKSSIQSYFDSTRKLSTTTSKHQSNPILSDTKGKKSSRRGSSDRSTYEVLKMRGKKGPTSKPLSHCIMMKRRVSRGKSERRDQEENMSPGNSRSRWSSLSSQEHRQRHGRSRSASL
jgi:hypothetical protein